MEYLRSLPDGAKMVADREGVVIESYLLAGDPNRDRREARYKELEALTKSSDALPVNLRARDLMEMRRYVFSGFRDSVSLSQVAGQIDLAASMKD